MLSLRRSGSNSLVRGRTAIRDCGGSAPTHHPSTLISTAIPLIVVYTFRVLMAHGDDLGGPYLVQMPGQDRTERSTAYRRRRPKTGAEMRPRISDVTIGPLLDVFRVTGDNHGALQEDDPP